ncbi:unnamed protein product [Trichogramma brassicae]|uniref:F-box domain-containing protein n=1 Tax=Trichogramma brassicae TaxID=86971 RepID=A0A6H5IHA5_9HYME|nr:unnamed protein product [Trichogramma brassicae]
MLFEVSDARVNASNKNGRTPLHLALEHGHEHLAKLLLRRGADPNRADERGCACLHVVCKRSHYRNDALLKILFEHGNGPIDVDARDDEGDTALRLALIDGLDKVAEILLRQGANPNLANDRGETPLHAVCQKKCDDAPAKIFYDVYDDASVKMFRDLCNGASAEMLLDVCNDASAKTFFEVCDELDLRVRVDAKDGSGRTPLQWAVAMLLPTTVDVLLDHDADLSSFVLPTENRFDEGFRKFSNDDDDDASRNFRLITASCAWTIVERLEKSGYELDRSEALTMMKLFSEHGLIEPSGDPPERWYDDEWLAWQAKRIKVNSSLSLYDFIRLTAEEAAKLLAPKDYLELARSKKLWLVYWGTSWDCCITHMCDKMSWKFFRFWALDPFRELIRYRLPIECCETILKRLTSRNLRRICLADAGRSLVKEEPSDASLTENDWETMDEKSDLNNFQHLPLQQVNATEEHFYTFWARITGQIDARDKSGNAPLHLAIPSLAYNILDLVRSLLEIGADPNLANDAGSTPMHLICKRRCFDGLGQLFWRLSPPRWGSRCGSMPATSRAIHRCTMLWSMSTTRWSSCC